MIIFYYSPIVPIVGVGLEEKKRTTERGQLLFLDKKGSLELGPPLFISIPPPPKKDPNLQPSSKPRRHYFAVA
jgi:hypothetical protein